MSRPLGKARIGLIGANATHCLLAVVFAASGLAACGGDEFEACSGEGCAAGAGGGEADAGAGGSGGEGGSGGSEASGSGGSDAVAASGGSGTGGTEASSGGASGGGIAGAGTDSAADSEPCDGACDADACCEGECVDLEADLAHCGACGRGCELSDAQAICDAGACRIATCSEGFLDCNADADDGCEVVDGGAPAVPMPRAPMLGAYTGSLHARDSIGSLRPAFSWTEVESTGCGVNYELQVDDECPVSGFQDCEFPTPELVLSGIEGNEAAPADDLPVEESVAPLGRRYFWRVRACDHQNRCSAWSDVRYLDVGRLEQDLTGDGYADVVALDNGMLWLGTGRADLGEATSQPAGRFEVATYGKGLTSISDKTLALHFLGDVNGDGFGDLGFPRTSPSSVLLIFGGPLAMLQAAPVSIALDSSVQGMLAPAGDFNHDGYADFLVGGTGEVSARRWVAYYAGSADLDETTPYSALWEAPEITASGYGSAASMGDFNADGYPDVALSAGPTGEIELLLGGAQTNFEPDATASFPSEGADCPPSSMLTLDMNGDPFDDVALLCFEAGLAGVIFGTATLDGTVAWSGTLKSELQHFASGDLDLDGFDDLLVSGPYAFLGAAAPSVEPLRVTDVVTPDETYAVAVADHNGDGTPDLIVDNTWYRGDGTLAPSVSALLAQDSDLDGVYEKIGVVSLAR